MAGVIDTSILLTVDAALTCTGYSFFINNQLDNVFLARSKAKSSVPERAMQIAEKIRKDAEIYKVKTMIIEYPRIYPGQSKADDDDILKLAYVCGAITAILDRKTEVRLIRPSEWKGQVPKNIHNNRVMSKCMPHELKLLETEKNNHNAIDAVGMGFWFLGRR